MTAGEINVLFVSDKG